MTHRRSISVLAPVVLALAAGTGAAASAATVAGPKLTEPVRTSALELATAYEVVEIGGLDAVVPGQPVQVRVPRAGGVVELDLQPHSVRALDFAVLIQDDMGIRQVPAPPVRTYRGEVAGLPGSEVYGSIIDGRFTGSYRIDDMEPWVLVEPMDEHDATAGRLEHIVIRGDDILHHGHECAVTEEFLNAELDAAALADAEAEARPAMAMDGAGRAAGSLTPVASAITTRAATPLATAFSASNAASNPTAPAQDPPFVGMSAGGATEVVDILIDADFQFLLQNGGSVPNTVADIENVMNGVSFVYERDVDLTWEITGILVRTSSSENPYTTNGAEALLCQVRDVWNSGGVNSIRRDVTHLFTGRNLSGSTIGIAFNGVICNVSAGSPCGGGVQNLAYGLSQSRFNTFQDARVSLTAHELGHNFNSPHCTGGNCHIMCASVNGCGGTFGDDLKFGVSSQNVIENFADSRNCLSLEQAPLTVPFEDTFPTTSINESNWNWFIDVAIDSTPPFPAPSAPNTMSLRSFGEIPFRKGDLRSNVIDTSGQPLLFATFSFALENMEVGDGLEVLYRTNLDRWATLISLPSGGTDQDFLELSLPLPPNAYHDGFRLRFVLNGDDFNDRVYLDDISVDVPNNDPEPCPGDADESGVVDFNDLLVVLAAWGPCPAPCLPDFDENGTVDFSDVLTVLSSFGDCP